MKNITIDMWRQSPVFMKFIQTNENSRSEDYDRFMSPIVSIISRYFIREEIERKLRSPIRPIIFEKDLNIVKHTII